MRRLDRTSLMSGCVAIVLGVIFLLEELGAIDVRASFVVPVVLVAIGVALIVGRPNRPPPSSDPED